MKLKKSCIALTLILTIIASLFVGCGANSTAFKEYKEYDQFRFYAYMTPPPANVGVEELANNPDYMTDEQYDWVKECGFNYGITIYESSYLEMLKVLEEFSEREIKLFIKDSNITQLIMGYNSGGMTAVQESNYKKAFENNLNEYMKYDGFAGIYASDEPKTAEMYGIGKASKYFYSLDQAKQKEWWVNLVGCNYGFHGSKTYLDHVLTCAKTTGTSRLSFDSYPLIKNNIIRTSFFYNLAQMAAIGKVRNKDFDTFILTMGHWDYRTTENYDDLAWQIYTSMAFGTRGIETFTYWTTMTTGEQVTHGLIDHYGNRTQTWYSMQEVISEVNSFQHMYMNAEWQGVLAYTANSNYTNEMFEMIPSKITVTETDVCVKMDSHQRIASVASDNDLLIGVFKDLDDRDAFLIVNTTDPELDDSATVNLKFNDCDYVAIYKKGEKVFAEVQDGEITLNMGSSEGYYVVPMEL
ncbi:MAG: hypothetical protein J6C62_00560 [Clostridia bacterium]|nr:hypothetical protein [Clostridia bacterium]